MYQTYIITNENKTIDVGMPVKSKSWASRRKNQLWNLFKTDDKVKSVGWKLLTNNN